MPKLTKQETFNKVAKHLLTQGVRSLDHQYACVYFGHSGLSCAAGCLLPNTLDENTIMEIEGKRADVGPVLAIMKKIVTNVSLVRELQVIHDEENPISWKEELKKLAIKHKLKYSVLSKFGEIK